MSRMIDADATTELLDVEYRRKMELVKKGETHLNTLAEGIFSVSVVMGTMPTVDAVEVVHGRWLTLEEFAEKIGADATGYSGGWVYCSECDQPMREINGWLYCPNCGAKMDGERKDND